MAKDYTSTLNLPTTEFPMRANLPQREPDMLKFWESIDLYNAMQENAKDKPLYLLHDGPPFSNGNIHMGTALNKILKDFINKSKTMMGYRVPYIPGWDNHGMPIESAIIKKNKLDRKKMSIPEFRTACHKFAEDFVKVQMGQFVRLGVSGDWENPYLTMNKEFESREIRVFGEMFKRGYIYKGLKPVYWCPQDETALAEAEIEYKTDKCTSIYVKFALKDDQGKLAGVCDTNKTYFIIWTTTTWTLPGNQAIALNPIEDYAIVKAANGEYYVVAEALVAATMAEGGVEEYEIVATRKGQDFEYMTAQHPFLDRDSLLVVADYVTMDSGTGCVHTAGGFGADDNVTCRRYGLPPLVPVDDRGFQTEEAGKFAGLRYDQSNDAILADMKESGALFASKEFEHEYPHCWRCKQPIIFRATPQWFCSVDAFKDQAVEACEKVSWMPEWGGERMKQMIRERADWCISRQRHWGLPIPVFYCEDCKKPICNDETIDRVAKIFAESGSNTWYEKTAAELLPEGFVCPHCGGKHFTQETDTLDGWFDSGSTHFSVLENKHEYAWPADLYLEGADQYRGWFQSSLLTAVGARGEAQAPYKAVLTHGWVVDGEGRAMHKSLGNGVDPLDMIKKYGADLVRLWAASADYRVDVRVSEAIFKQLSDAYRKIRNTVRILIADLNDFNPNTDALPFDQLLEIDRWIISAMNELTRNVRASYEVFEFHPIAHSIGNFCTTELSKLYIDITKDRVYTEKADSTARRSAQTAMYFVLSGLVRLLAPILAFTAEEMWQAIPHVESDNTKSVFLNEMPAFEESLTFPEVAEKWNRLFEMRDDVMKALELARAEKLVGKSLEAKVTLYTKDTEMLAMLNDFAQELNTVFIVSGVHIAQEDAPSAAYVSESGALAVLVEPADGCKCDRCWSFSTEGENTEDGGFICARCKTILSL
ncbi:MAG: isoleucine--tRNA ligase [Ruminococcaceae bacterium]|nr:isoleucine--tRNA ligase [Oscillospiraceae bacterium]